MPTNDRIHINGPLQALFDSVLVDAVAEVTNNVNYIEVLENGRVVNDEGRLSGSEQAPEGMVRAFMPEYEAFAQSELQAEYERELRNANPDLGQAVMNGIDSAALGIAAFLVTRTPIDTSRARNAWQVELSDGESQKAPGT